MLILSPSSDNPLRPRHSVWLDGHPAGILDQIPVASAKGKIGPIDSADGDLFLVKLYGEYPGVSNRSTELVQYLVRRAKPIASKKGDLSVACQFPGRATLQITKHSPLTFVVIPNETTGSTRGRAIQYEMIDAEVMPGTQSCKMVTPTQGENASDFEAQATLFLANMLSSKDEFRRAGQTRLELLHMRPRAENAEDVALLSIRELSSYNDGGCTFEPPEGEPVPLPADLWPLFKAYDEYLAMFPNGKNAAKILFRRASSLSGCRHHQEAARLYDRIVQSYPNDELAPYARDHRDEELSKAKKQLLTPVPGRPATLPIRSLQQSGSPQ